MDLMVLVIGLGPTGVEVARALAESGKCCLSLGDDTLASKEWRDSASCLIRRRAESSRGKEMVKRSQFLSMMLTSSSARRSVQALSPVGDTSIVERYDVVIMTDPTLPHAIAFNEHARAVGCGFLLTESRGAVGRLFRDLGGPHSRSLRKALLDPQFTAHRQYRRCSGGRSNADVMAANETPAMPQSPLRSNTGALPPSHQHTSINARETVLSGLLSSSDYALQQENGDEVGAAVGAAPGRCEQLHLYFQGLHVFWLEHGHLPVALDRDQADEVLRIAEDLVQTGKQVPKGFSSQPDSVDAALCRRVVAISRLSIPAVNFQLGGLVAAIALEHLRARRLVRPKEGIGVPATEEDQLHQQGAERQWIFVDELDAGAAGDPRQRSESTIECCDSRVDADQHTLEAWLGTYAGESVEDARVAVIGCGRLGRDLARCFLLTGACAGRRGRLVLIDHGDAAPSRPSSPRRNSGGIITRSRAAVLRDLIVEHAGPDNFHVSSFEGGAQDTGEEMDLWEGVDAIVVCAGRGGATGGFGGAAPGGCEELVRFVSHKCVLHGKPLVWGWAAAAGEGGAGVEVMAPRRTSCLVCSSHGGIKQLIERRTTIQTNTNETSETRAPTSRALHTSSSATYPGRRDGRLQDAWDPNGRCFEVARAATVGVMVAELVKVLKPRCRREELRNWRLEVEGGGFGRIGGSGGDEGYRKGNLAHYDARTPMDNEATILPVVEIPDPPRMVLSTHFDPFSGDSLRAIPEGFTEWGVEEIRPSSLPPASSGNEGSRRGQWGCPPEDRFSLRALLRIVFARFGIDAKEVSAAAPGSECRKGAWGCREGGGSGGGKLIWAEWEEVDRKQGGQSEDGGRSAVSKMDQSVLCLWKKEMASPTSRGEEVMHASHARKEPRFLFLDIRGAISVENAVIPVLKYWVR